VSPKRLALIREYFACFNERRFDDAAALFTEDAVLEQVPFHCRERGGAAYLLFAALWTRAFPDAQVRIENVTAGPNDVFEVELSGSGTHMGDLSMGGCVFRPTGVRTELRLRELLQFRGERITVSCLSFDLQELAHQLARVDDTQLLMHLARLRYLEDQLRSVPADSNRRHDLLDHIGRELDAARHVVRPYFAR
jgi:predicted ester cyclase